MSKIRGMTAMAARKSGRILEYNTDMKAMYQH
jgi:hypothetical protein